MNGPWPYMVSHGGEWSCVVICGNIWLYTVMYMVMVVCGHVWELRTSG